MEPNAIPAHLKNAVPAVESLQEYSENLGFSVLDICLSYLSLVNWASSYVIGVANKEQLNSILQSKSVLLDKSDLPPQLGDFILDPRKWNSK
jgi:aryl-alcohol dehydrogenase-like predicted oxidoreductase